MTIGHIIFCAIALPVVGAAWADWISDTTAVLIVAAPFALYFLMKLLARPVDLLHEGRDPNKEAIIQHLRERELAKERDSQEQQEREMDRNFQEQARILRELKDSKSEKENDQ